MVIEILAATAMSISNEEIFIGEAVVSFRILKTGIPLGISCLCDTFFTWEQEMTISRIRRPVTRNITGGFVRNEMTGTVCLHKENEKMFPYPKKECESNCKIYNFKTKWI